MAIGKNDSKTWAKFLNKVIPKDFTESGPSIHYDEDTFVMTVITKKETFVSAPLFKRTGIASHMTYELFKAQGEKVRWRDLVDSIQRQSFHEKESYVRDDVMNSRKRINEAAEDMAHVRNLVENSQNEFWINAKYKVLETV